MRTSNSMPRITRGDRMPAVPMRVCAHCNQCFRTDCSGQLSLGHRAWYCSGMCYQLQRALDGEPMSRDQLRLLAAMREKHYPKEKLDANAENTAHLIETRQIKVIIDKEIRDQVWGSEEE